jgi:2-dehydropantoate 2-reductase
MRYLFIGAGAIGTYLGGHLLNAEKDVSFLDRPEQAKLIRENGISITGRHREFSLQGVRIYDSPAQLKEQPKFDVAVMAMKSYDTQTAIQQLTKNLVPVRDVISFQNGVENERTIASFIGEENVLSGTVTSAISRKPDGGILIEKARGIGIHSKNALARTIAADFAEAGITTWLFADEKSMKWSKMLTNLLGNASCAILNMTPSEVFRDPLLYELEVTQIREAVEVMKAAGIAPVDLPGVPVKLLISILLKLPLQLSQPFLKQTMGRGRGGKMPSLHIDLHSGRSESEVDFLNGAVVRTGKQFGIESPVNQLLTTTLLSLVKQETTSSEYNHQPEKLLSRLQSEG